MPVASDWGMRPSFLAWLRTANPRSIATVPLIYSAGLPLLLLDLWVSTYQSLCFPLYGIAPVRRRDYFAFDRHRLTYLNAVERVHCTYCSYATGVVSYVREVIARTEAYWCPIAHRQATPTPHRWTRDFFAYGDRRAYRRGLIPLRRTLRRQPPPARRSRAA